MSAAKGTLISPSVGVDAVEIAVLREAVRLTGLTIVDATRIMVGAHHLKSMTERGLLQERRGLFYASALGLTAVGE